MIMPLNAEAATNTGVRNQRWWFFARIGFKLHFRLDCHSFLTRNFAHAHCWMVRSGFENVEGNIGVRTRFRLIIGFEAAIA